MRRDVGDIVWSRPLSVGAANNLHQLGDLAPLSGLVAGCDRILDAVRDMIAQDFLLGTPQCGAHSRNLRNDVNAVAIFSDHARKAANLPLDSVQPLDARCLDALAHESYIPQVGI